ncbi:lipocalin family protein [Lachnospiraceae bacterium ZAX-1]
MKKIFEFKVKTVLIFALVPCMMLALVACGGDAPSNVPGTWKLTSISMNDTEVSVEDMDISMTLIFTADGTVTMALLEESETGKWTEEGKTVTLSGTSKDLAFTLDKNKMTSEKDDEGAMLILEKQ